MLKKDRQSRYIEQAARLASAHLKAFCHSRGAEELHRFRVEVKRLQALLVLLKGHPGDGGLMKSFLPVRMIYKKAGAIRLLDVHKEMMSGVKYIKPAYALKQARLRDKKTTKFISACKSYQLKLDSSASNISRQLFDVESRFIIKKCRKHIGKIAVVLSKSKNDIEAMHKVRKKIKMLIYTGSFIPKPVAAKIQLNKKYLNKLEHLIGDWHDIAQTAEVLTAAGIANPRVFQKLKLQENTAQLRFRKLAKGFSTKVNL